ncbi:hypothetical protein K438DRAFT_2002011 [Mycena galopus ATCC 62051]|nr:hypothetical protein K438DRAFT_2002011 [Mycena galopus ATCC 62051]
MTGSTIEFCSSNRTEELEPKLEADVEGYATRVLFELIGLLAIFDPPRSDTIDDVLVLGARVKSSISFIFQG